MAAAQVTDGHVQGQVCQAQAGQYPGHVAGLSRLDPAQQVIISVLQGRVGAALRQGGGGFSQLSFEGERWNRRRGR